MTRYRLTLTAMLAVILAIALTGCLQSQIRDKRAEMDQWRTPCAQGDPEACLRYNEAFADVHMLESRLSSGRAAGIGAAVGRMPSPTYEKRIDENTTLTY